MVTLKRVYVDIDTKVADALKVKAKEAGVSKKDFLEGIINEAITPTPSRKKKKSKK